MTSSRLKFLRRVRIHDGECGAVARALHHSALKCHSSNLMSILFDEIDVAGQAERKIVFRSTH